jgi:thiol-disulfide isomerase/thioredoxin
VKARRLFYGATLCLAAISGRIARGDDKPPRDAPPSRYPVVSGVGLALSSSDDGVTIFKVVKGSAAEKSGKLKEGDRILSVRNRGVTTEAKSKPLGELVSLIRGPVGTDVTLEVSPAGEGPASLVTLRREAIELPGLLDRRDYDALIGKPVPTVHFATLDRTSDFGLAKHAGKVVVVEFWASWCGACLGPVDRLLETARAHPEWKDRVVLLTATTDANPKNAAKVVEGRKWTELTHLWLAPEDLGVFKIATIPAVLIVSPDGKVAAAGDPHSISVEEEVAKLLGEGDDNGHDRP